MTFQEAQMEIESGSMVTRLNVASGLKTFLRGIQGERAVQELRSILVARDIQEQVLSRLIQLSRQRIDRRYENPWDTAITVYLWVISSVDQALSVLAAEIVAQAPHCWWAQRLSSQLLSEQQMHTISTVQPFNMTPQSMRVPYVAVQDTAFAQVSLDNAVLSDPLNRPIRILMPNLTGSVSQSEVSNLGELSYTFSAANQDLAGMLRRHGWRCYFSYTFAAANQDLAAAA